MLRPSCARVACRSSMLFLLLVVVGSATSGRADVVVSSLVGGPVGGDGGTFTVTTSGTISSASDGIVAAPGNGITELYALGVVEALATGFVNGAGNFTSLASVTGTLGGAASGVVNSGSIGYFQVSTGIVRGADGPGLVSSGSIALVQVMADGRIGGAATAGVRVEAAGGIGTLQNFGLVGGLSGVASSGTIGSLTNEVGGAIAGSGYGILVSGGGIGALANAGSITGREGLIAAGTIGSVSNAATGTIAGDFRGVLIEATGALPDFDNAGTISAAAGTAIQFDFGATVDDFDNAGTVTSTEGLISAANVGRIRNEGLVAGTGNRGIGLISGTVFSVINTGTITGVGTAIESSASLTFISNLSEGVISGGWRGVLLADPTKYVSTVENYGKIEGSDGIENRGLIFRVENGGTITGNGEWGISNGSASFVQDLRNTGTIQGAISGVGTSGTAVLVSNIGTVRGVTGDAIAVASTGMMSSLWNYPSGTLVGGHRGVSNHGTLDLFINDGVVTSPAESGLFSAPGSTLGIVTTSGTIQADFYGILASGISGTITNSGIVAATTYHGFAMNGSGAKLDTLANSGTISGGQRGVLVDVDATLSTFDNSGLVTGGDWGVFVADGSRLFTLTNSGRIASATEGIGIVGTSGTITNSGKITAAAGRGILVDGGRVAEILSTGTISGNSATGAGVEITATGSVASFTNRGIVGGDRAVVVTGSATVALLSNSGTLAGATVGLAGTGGRVTALVNDQMGRIAGDTVAGIEGGDYDTIDNFGSITGPNGVSSTGSVGTFTNRSTGDIVATGTAALQNFGPLTTFVNEAGGRIESSCYGVWFAGPVTSASNAGQIVSTASNAAVIAITAPVGAVANSGTVAGAYGIALDYRGFIGALDNTATGAIDATITGIVDGGRGLGPIVNAGRIAGGHHGVVDGTGGVALTNLSGGTITGTAFAGVVLQCGASMLVNEAGAVIESLGGSAVEVGYGLLNPSYVSGTLSNAGVIRGDDSGVLLRVVPRAPQSALRKLVNTGTIVATGAGGGPALEIESGASFGDPTGAGGPALTSTGPGASIGRIESSGTVHHGFRVENQDVVVTAGGSPGTFAGSTLIVPDGNLTFGAGQITLGADVAVGGGAGTFFVDGTLRLLGIQSVTGAFEERTGGTVLIGLFGENPGDYGHLDITGSADFKGSLALDTTGLSGGLANGQTFGLFTFGSSIGGFGALSVDGTNLPSLGGGLWSYGSFILSENWTPTTMSLSVIRNSEKPIPEIDPAGMASVLALVTGSLGLLERRRLARKRS
ncbi:MAG: hypothetical protein KGQ61_10355 [Planctomycetes bacterium]|nr:hypothetical protein [Planctomycetota bacterium]